LCLLTLFDGFNGEAEGGVSIFETYTIEDEADGADVEPLEGGGGFTELGAGGFAGLEDDDGTVDKAGEVLGFGGLGQGGCVGEDEVVLLGFGVSGDLLEEGGGAA